MWLKAAHQLLYPERCLLCAASTASAAPICDDCLAGLPRNDSACSRCALPLPTAAGHSLCGHCQKHPPRFDRAIAPFQYLSPLDHLLGRFKHGGSLTHGRLLAHLLSEAIEQLKSSRPEIILPTPIHPIRLRERGFSQTLELARHLSNKIRIPWNDWLLIKQRHTPAQQGLDRRARRGNVRGSFHCATALPWRHVALLDDVITTGTTADEMTRVLKRAGVEEVSIWAVARTPDPH